MDKQNYVLCRKFYLTLISAENLPKVRKFFKSKVYAKVSFGGDKKTEQRIKADKHGELNPVWNYTMKYTIEESSIIHYGLQLVIKLYCQSKLGDRYIGEIHTSIKDLFDYAYRRGGSANLSLPMKKGDAETGAILKFSFRFGERIQKKKPGFWRRVLLPGACTLLRVAGLATLGVDVPVSFSGKLDIVDVDKLNEK
ncbi:soybean protein regulated by cold-2 [Abeliophyllum distichum]|uniref:Soybean protein regulated by cold-2 n=1 Tax=Abeliophyllum distichum TaxID=126358 RepID=A0ABD1TKK5_9LAMI